MNVLYPHEYKQEKRPQNQSSTRCGAGIDFPQIFWKGGKMKTLNYEKLVLVIVLPPFEIGKLTSESV